jgi:hypothetical protein
MRRFTQVVFLALPLAATACGKTMSREDASGNTNWLKPCETDAECGGLSCSCGLCRDACPAPDEISPPEPDEMTLPDPVAPIIVNESRDRESQGRDMAVDAIGRVTLVGGTQPTISDLQLTYPALWLAQFGPQGFLQGTYRDYPEEGQSTTGRSLVVLSTGTLTLSTTYDGADSPFLRFFEDMTPPTRSFLSLPGFTTMRPGIDDGVLATGSRRLNDVNEPRPFTSAWIGRFHRYIYVDDSATLIWQQERQGVEGSISNITVASSDSAGNLLVGGSLGTAADSNASEPYLARLDADGNFIWEESVHLDEVTHCDASAVAFTADGGSLAAIPCGDSWLRSYAPEGDVRWERRQDRAVTAVLGLQDGGYAVGSGGSTARLQRFDAQHRLVWEQTAEGCSAYTRLAESNGLVIALAQCEPGYSLSWLKSP